MSRKRKSTVEGWVTRIVKLHFGGLIVKNPPEDAYRVRLGWYDRATIDAVLAECQTLLDSPETPAEKREELYWHRSLLLWDLGRFEEAEADTQAFISVTVRASAKGVAQRNLGAIRKRKGAHELMHSST